MNLKDLKAIILNIVLPFIVVVLMFSLCDVFESLLPYFGLVPLLGLVAGPYGALIACLSVGILDFNYNLPLMVIIVDILGTFLCSYFPYRIWYSFSGDNKFISLI